MDALWIINDFMVDSKSISIYMYVSDLCDSVPSHCRSALSISTWLISPNTSNQLKQSQALYPPYVKFQICSCYKRI
ncbi:hypothetical protein P153DRAFT_157049 [Dothidotthia symphoricarpi CBS 119687]|uniref:Uncharacterized protein n=1 Tax=Dothidotthia symphoricarpi CBS 119687 TaxID=1392245 RepID=A0A6A6API1_9PLEO|nr:uncharacterized protein P153DRAFT_157049 [Dothidotthia symphoricarpi CBS 119687]KAF2133446.1 hypothetical protein P153DRAFT_157049 [Dothidotthia symphoricarpi CBS 119687]